MKNTMQIYNIIRNMQWLQADYQGHLIFFKYSAIPFKGYLP